MFTVRRYHPPHEQPEHRWSTWPTLVPAAVLATLASIRAVHLPPSRDEMATAMFASLSSDGLLRAVHHVDTVVAPFYALEALADPLVPGGAIGLRVPSIVASVVTVFVVVALARRWWGAAPALVAGLAFATNPLTLQMATTARPYACATLAVALAAWSASVAIDSTGRRAAIRWTAYSGCVIAVGLLHLFAILAVLPLSILTAGRGRRALVSLAVATGVAFAVLLPFAMAAASQRAQVAWIPPPDAVQAVGTLANLVRSPELIGLGPADVAACALVAGLTIAGLAAALGRARAARKHLSPVQVLEPAHRDLPRLIAALALTVVPWSALLLVSIAVVPVLRTAYVAPSVVGLSLLLAGSVRAVTVRLAIRDPAQPAESGRGPRFARASIGAAVTAVLVLAVASGAAGAATRFWQDDFPSLGAAVSAAVTPGDLLVVVQRHHETGLAGGVARTVGDDAYAAATMRRLTLGTQPTVEVRRVTALDPLRTESTDETPARGRVFVISTTFPIGEADETKLRGRGLGCVVDRTPAHEERYGGLVLRDAGCAG